MCLPISLKELAITGCVKNDLLYDFVVFIWVLIYLLHYFFICRLIHPPPKKKQQTTTTKNNNNNNKQMSEKWIGVKPSKTHL